MMSNTTSTEPIRCLPMTPAFFILSLCLVVTPLHLLIVRVLIVRFRLALPRHKILLCLLVSDDLQILGITLITFIGLGLQPTVISQSCQILRQVIEVIAAQTHCASTGFILLLAIERYIACIYSLRFYAIITPTRANNAVVCVCVISILFGLLALHPNAPNYSQSLYGSNPRSLWLYITTVVVSSIFLTVIQGSLYRLSRKKLKVVPQNMFGTQKEKYDSKRRQLKLSFAASIVVIMYVVCMLPMACSSAYIFFNPKRELVKVTGIAVFLTMLNTFADPFVYGFGMADMRQGIKREFKQLKQRVCKK